MLEHTESQTLLLVGGEAADRAALAALLGERHALVAAAHGEAALAILHGATPPDLILLDVTAADRACWELCRAIRQDARGQHIPLVLLAARGDTESEAQGYRLGAADVITRPLHPAALAARLSAQLRLHSQALHLEALVRQRAEELESTWLKVIFHLVNAAEFRDGGTGSHVLRIGRCCRALAIKLGFGEREAGLLFSAMPMYDIGHIGIPDKILLKPGKLDAGELAIMQRHAEAGAAIIGECSSPLLQCARVIAETHHEKWDGTGYPRGMKGEEIPMTGRIAAIADVFDALVSPRPYKQPWTTAEAIALLQREAGRQFDPEIVAAFIEILPEIEEIYRQSAG